MRATPSTPRVLPGGLSELGLLNWLVCRVAARLIGAPDVHLFSTLARNTRLFRGWLCFAGRLMPAGTLPRSEAELVILRVAQLRDCEYERAHHRRIARRYGLNAASIGRIAAGPSATGWTERERVLLTAVDALVQTKDIDDHAWAELSRYYGAPQLVELCMLVGHYELLATTIRALRIARDF